MSGLIDRLQKNSRRLLTNYRTLPYPKPKIKLNHNSYTGHIGVQNKEMAASIMGIWLFCYVKTSFCSEKFA